VTQNENLEKKREQGGKIELIPLPPSDHFNKGEFGRGTKLKGGRRESGESGYRVDGERVKVEI